MKIYLLLLMSFLNLQTVKGMSPLLENTDETSLPQPLSKLSIIEIQPSNQLSPLWDEGKGVQLLQEIFNKKVINKAYNRDIVTQFVKNCPTPKKLATIMEVDPATISKLKSPKDHGSLHPTAKSLWTWLEATTVESIIDQLELTDKDIKKMAKALDPESLCISNSVTNKDKTNSLSISNTVDEFDINSSPYLSTPEQLIKDVQLDLKKLKIPNKEINEIINTCNLAIFYFVNVKELAQIYKPKEKDTTSNYHQRLHSPIIKRQLTEILKKKAPKVKSVTLFKLPQLEEIYNSGNNVETFLETSMKMPFELIIRAYALAKNYEVEVNFFTTAFQTGCIAKKSNKISKWITLMERKNNQG
ncbi:hypothetical protein [Candidatus Odyssella acanthamoebae]|uniref:Uncharacterized protein n=1 Tax=Candidatus Odyssella acanthamoebae TaxID=91604 RepID=A0A077AWZ9_9PROT|nr:hypothetical protein [Candidatus Paracaedibacter acanthamoebae]AIK97091.1 hypothetical protein ID47_10685 [Candidatus Paracaedibacter acanthamoebae]